MTSPQEVIRDSLVKQVHSYEDWTSIAHQLMVDLSKAGYVIYDKQKIRSLPHAIGQEFKRFMQLDRTEQFDDADIRAVMNEHLDHA